MIGVHKSIINGDDEDLACRRKFGVIDIAGNMGVGARWACIAGSAEFSCPPADLKWR